MFQINTWSNSRWQLVPKSDIFKLQLLRHRLFDFVAFGMRAHCGCTEVEEL